MTFSVANSEMRWAESAPSQTDLALLIQNGLTWAKLAFKTLRLIWLLEPIWLFSFYSRNTICVYITSLSAINTAKGT